MKGKTTCTAIFQKIGLVLLLVYSYVSVFAQSDQVAIVPGYQIVYCSSNQGEVLPNQEILLTIKGPENKKWFVSYSFNNGPTIIVNNNIAIDESEYILSLFFQNTNTQTQNVTIELKDAWLEDLTPLPIPADSKSAIVQVMPLPKPEVYDYLTKVKSNSTQDYKAKVGKNSNHSIWVPQGAKLLLYDSKVLDDRQEINLRIQWADKEGVEVFKLLETTPVGCISDTLFAPVELVRSFQVDLGTTKTICEGESVLLTPDIDLSSTYSFLWSTGETTKEITVSKAGNYVLTATDVNDGQKVEASIDVVSHSAPVINIDDYIVIKGTEHVLDIYTEGASYLWFDGSSSSSVILYESGIYSVSMTSKYGCTTSKTFKAKRESELFTLSLPALIHMCGNEKMTLSPNTDIDQSYLYKWNNGSTEAEILIEKSGMYSVTLTDPDGFSKTATTEVIYHPNPIVDLGDDFVLWDGESKILDAGNSGASFLWSTGENTQSITVASGGTFYVTVSDQYGCSNKDEVFVDYRNGKKFAVFLGEDQKICTGDSVLISAIIEGNPVGPLSYKWQESSQTDSRIYVKTEGDHCVEVSDANGNKETDCMTVQLLSVPRIDLGEDIVSHDNDAIVLDAGTPNLFYLWSTGEISQTISIKKDGTYWAKVTNKLNCSATDTIRVNFTNGYPFVGIPKAFSPNGDTCNDKLFIRGSEVKSINLRIYNRAGRKLFETQNIDHGWDGSFKGKPQDIDTYLYILRVTYLDGKKIMKKGNVTLLR